ncbi:EVE domain-containing protein [Parathalassolituus penaei]|uniref:EVE domain-containing protein n=1 Tax=Parathalassolituus penaei TaxID=2997323 RepID=A0A9X3IR00_9GAMM|nr:EVE domain-containing protein [Parathalassolituus penaei]MCY0964702.1 EVE domain-containing protein [Parathalassolituus penaei]
MNYWLFKSEPDVFGIQHLAVRPQQTAFWEGVRNYQARNFLRDEVKVGDLVLFYHSSCKDVGIAGIAEVVREAYPDHTQFDPESKYFDPKASPDNPRWVMVDVKLVEKFSRVLSLASIKAMPEITELALVKKGHRLSIMPVLAEEYERLVARARR